MNYLYSNKIFVCEKNKRKTNFQMKYKYIKLFTVECGNVVSILFMIDSR